jgi:hypothetical protein
MPLVQMALVRTNVYSNNGCFNEVCLNEVCVNKDDFNFLQSLLQQCVLVRTMFL